MVRTSVIERIRTILNLRIQFHLFKLFFITVRKKKNNFDVFFIRCQIFQFRIRLLGFFLPLLFIKSSLKHTPRLQIIKSC